jgi:hypothetical protein
VLARLECILSSTIENVSVVALRCLYTRLSLVGEMDRVLRVECSDEFSKAPNSPREVELFRELGGKFKTVAEAVDGVKATVSAIPNIQDYMEQIKRTLAESISCSKRTVLNFCSSAAKGGPLFDNKISKYLLPVSTVFTA